MVTPLGLGLVAKHKPTEFSCTCFSVYSIKGTYLCPLKKAGIWPGLVVIGGGGGGGGGANFTANELLVVDTVKRQLYARELFMRVKCRLHQFIKRPVLMNSHKFVIQH